MEKELDFARKNEPESGRTSKNLVDAFLSNNIWGVNPR